MTVSLVTYKGLTVVSPDPIGDAGLALNNNIKIIADNLFTQGTLVRTASRVVSVPPVSPADGVAYIVPSNATGVWAGKYNKVTYFYAGTWFFLSPLDGWYSDVSDEKSLLRYTQNVGNWVTAISSGSGEDQADIGPVFTYVDGLVSRVEYTNGNYKLFTYSSGILIQLDYVTTTNTTRKIFNYNPDGTLGSITQTIF
jgi:hypothetical protein